MRLELGFAALLMASLWAKAAFNDYRMTPDYERLARDIEVSLREQGFVTRVLTHKGRSPSVIATRGPCRVFLRAAEAAVSLHGGYVRDSVAIGSLRYRIGNDIYSAPPTYRLWRDEFVQYSLGRIGIKIDRIAPLAYAFGANCGRDPVNMGNLQLNLSVQRGS